MNKVSLLFLAVCLAALISHSGLAQDSHDVEYQENQNKPYGEKPRPSDAENGSKPYGEGSHAPAEIPPGMELRTVGGIHTIVPQGTRIAKKGSLVTLEGTEDFAARNFKEINARLGKIEATQNDLKKTVEDLKQEISDL